MNSKLSRILVLLPLCIACSTYRWVKTDGPPSDPTKDERDCRFKGHEKFPINIATNISTDYKSVPDKATKCTPKNGSMICQEQEIKGSSSYKPVQEVSTKDVNEHIRKEFITACMEEKGWSWQKVEN